jgi:hypothetical protein
MVSLPDRELQDRAAPAAEARPGIYAGRAVVAAWR